MGWEKVHIPGGWSLPVGSSSNSAGHRQEKGADVEANISAGGEPTVEHFSSFLTLPSNHMFPVRSKTTGKQSGDN